MLPPRITNLSATDKRIMEEAIVSFMHHCRFFAYYFHDQMELYYTHAVPTCATDSKRIFVNPTYFAGLIPTERCFALGHEVWHVVGRDAQRMKYYGSTGLVPVSGGKFLPFDEALFNIAADYPINAGLVDGHIGSCNPSWLYDPSIPADWLAEQVYEKLYKKPQGPGRGPGPGQGPGGRPCDDGDDDGDGDQPGTTGSNPGNSANNPGGQQPTKKTYADATGRRSGTRDQEAEANQGRFDGLMEPAEDAPSETQFREAVLRAKVQSAGSMPQALERRVQEIIDPQVSWREHLRFRITGKLGSRRETWDSPNRRRLVLEPLVYMPGRRGNGANLITVVIDTSGSITERELTAFFSETAGILNDCRPRQIQVIWCDAKVHKVEYARSLDELLHMRPEGGGGTSFKPPFEYLVKEKVRPDALVYLTDMYPNDGWPEKPVGYDVIWCATTDVVAPWGDTVPIKV